MRSNWPTNSPIQLKHAKLQPLSTAGMDLGPLGAPAAEATEIEENMENTAFDMELENFMNSINIQKIGLQYNCTFSQRKMCFSPFISFPFFY